MKNDNSTTTNQKNFELLLSQTSSELDRLELIFDFCRFNYNSYHELSLDNALKGLKICRKHDLRAEAAALKTYIAFYQWHNMQEVDLNELACSIVPDLIKYKLYREFGLAIIVLCLIEWAKGNHENAFNIVNKAFDDLKYKKHKDNALIRLHWALGVFYFDLGEIDQSLYHYNLSKAYVTPEEQDISLVSYVNLGIASVYKKQSKINAATEIITQVLKESKKKNIWMTEARGYFELGNIALIKGNKMKAYELINESYIVRKRFNAEPAMVTSLIALAEISLEVGDQNDAENLVQKAIILCNKQNLKPKLAKCFLLLSNIAASRNNFELSYKYLKSNQMLEKEIINIERNERNKYLQLNYKAKKAEKDNISQRIINSKLKDALDREKELNDLKSHFVATASHQFRTPLSIIKANTELFKLITKTSDFKLKPELVKASERIEKEIDRMVKLMDEILILGKINTGRSMELNLESVDIVLFCQNIINRFNELEKDNQRLILNTIGEAKKTILDKTLISHSMNNLITNALKYAPEGIIKVDLLFKQKTIDIKVSDQGIGIPEKEIPNLFQPFHRATNVRDISGTGLGLVIVKEYIETHGGKISVKSKLNEGTTFTITLPYSPKQK